MKKGYKLENLFCFRLLLTYVALYCVLFALPADTSLAATYYMPDDFPNLQVAFANMSAGDTLVIRDGIYTGNENIISSTNHPPKGTKEKWTKVIAEHPGRVFFGNADINIRYFDINNLGNAFILFKGLIWLGGGMMNNHSNYMKFLQCGAGGNVVNTAGSATFHIFYSSYVLCEDCFAWGGGRYAFIAYQSDHIIFRRCVGRIDAVNTTHNSRTEPIGGIALYYSSYCEVQNCIIIDSNSKNYWVYQNSPGAAFTEPNGGGTNNYFRGCIALNNTMPFQHVASGYSHSTKINCIGWDNYPGWLCRGTDTNLSHLTLGSINYNFANLAAIHNYEGDTSVRNSILTRISVNSALNSVSSDYNCLYNNLKNYTATIQGPHDITSINPLDNSLKYLPRIEPNSDLSSKASDGGDIGATVMKKIGVSGTLWGEPGYNIITNENLWPWPNENIIKENFRLYSHSQLSGKRGFCADGNGLYGGPITLTSYIWEYLGNPCPFEICNYGSNYHTTTLNNNTPPNNVPSGNKPPSADAGSDQTVTDKDGNGSEDVVLDGSKSSDSDGSITDYIWLENGIQIATGVNPTVTLNVGSHDITLQVIDDDNATATDTVQIIVNSLKQSAVVMQTLQDFEDGVLWIPGGNQDPTGHRRGWAFLDAGPNARIEIDNIGANGSHKSLKITFDSNNPQIYFRSDDKIRDYMPEAKGANRMSFYVRFPEGFPVQTLPFRYDTWQFGTFIHDPNDWSDLHAATFESDHGIHHYYHRLTVEQVGNGWVKYIITTQPDQANYSGSTVPPNIPYYFDQLGRFYFHFGPEAGGPDPGRPFTIWIDEIKFYYDDGSVGGQIHNGGQNDSGFDGEFIPDAVTGVNRAPSLTEFTASPNPADNPKRNIKFTVQASDPDGDKLTYSIDFGDGSKASASVATHAYVREGNYKVEAVVFDGHGHTVAKTIQITVDDNSPNKTKIIQVQK